MATIGDRIKKLTKEYIQIYENLKDDPVLGDNAGSIALADPILKQFTWENVLKEVRVHVEADEKKRSKS